jgi:septal ring factor EnvC (AmiA/AmiB activator)
MRLKARHTRWLLLLATALVAALALALSTGSPARAGGQSLSQLNHQLGANQATQSDLHSEIASLNSEVATLDKQISLVRSREGEVRAELSDDEAQLADTQTKLTAENQRLAKLRRALKRAQTILSAQLVSSYEQPKQDLVAVVLTANGFRQMLNQLQFLRNAETSQQQIIAFTTKARAAANQAATRLRGLRSQQQTMTKAATTQMNALSGMNQLLSSREASLDNIESARRTALANAQATGGRLRSAIATIKAEQAAAARRAAAEAAAAQKAAAQAAAAAAASSSTSSSSSASSSSVSAPASGGWAIPSAVVMCESGGQNLPPNSAGASGYYQILPSTWTGEGGAGPAAYLAPKSEQDAIAAKLWDGGAGARNWVCASIVGII